MPIRFHHDTTVTVTWPGTDPTERESDEVDVRLHVIGWPAQAAVPSGPLPCDAAPATIELDRFEIIKLAPPSMGERAREVYLKPIPACYPDTNDQGVIDAVEAWFAEHSEECWESAPDDEEAA